MLPDRRISFCDAGDDERSRRCRIDRNTGVDCRRAASSMSSARRPSSTGATATSGSSSSHGWIEARMAEVTSVWMIMQASSRTDSTVLLIFAMS